MGRARPRPGRDAGFGGGLHPRPPPPANQLVLVTTERAYENTGLFVPVTVTGTFRSSATKTALAEIGYTLSADRIEPYEP